MGIRGRPFVPGRSGNPNGRPRTGTSVAEYIRRLAGEDARAYVDELHRLATGEHDDTRARLVAIGILLERGYGKPQPSTVEYGDDLVSVVSVTELTDDELHHVRRILVRQGNTVAARATHETRRLIDADSRQLALAPALDATALVPGQ